jgi:nucleoid DNA-binding protein
MTMSRGYQAKAVTVGTLARTLSANYGVSERMAYSLLREGLDLITSALVDGQRVHLTGLGTFTTRNWKAKEQTTHMGPMTVPARAYPAFRPAKHLKALPVRETLPEPQPSAIDECPFL